MTDSVEGKKEATGEVHWEDISVTVRWEAHSHSLEFKAREGTKQRDGSIFYFADDTEHTFETMPRFIDGFVKWDGCSHFYVGEELNEQSTGYLHLCGGHGILALTETAHRVFRLAAEHIPHFDADTADLEIVAPS